MTSRSHISNHAQLALTRTVIITYGCSLSRDKANDGVVYAIWAWIKYVLNHLNHMSREGKV